MKFVIPYQVNKNEQIEEISDDDDNSHSNRKENHSHIEKKKFIPKPLIFRAPFIQILLEDEPKKQQINKAIIELQDSESDDIIVLPNQKTALNKESEQIVVVKASHKAETCSICFQDIKLPAAKIPCGHVYCGDCLIQSSKVSNKCPNCRAVFKRIMIGSKIVKVKDTSIQQHVDFEDFDNEPCYVCGRNDRPQQLLVCDNCEFAFCHVYCDSRLQGEFPQDEWFCMDCSLIGRRI